MTKNEQERLKFLEMLERDQPKLLEKISKLAEDKLILKEELNQYRTAVAGVKWLWEQVNNQQPFQL